MTYKAIVKEMVRTEACKWVESLLKENDIEFRYVCANTEDVNLENDKKADQVYWDVKVEIWRSSWDITLIVGGTVDDMCGICKSVIWDRSQRNILWMSVEETRKQLGIGEFKIA